MTNCPLCKNKVPMRFDEYWCNSCLIETLLDHSTDEIERMKSEEHYSTTTTIAVLQYLSDIAFELLQRTYGKRLAANAPIFDKEVIKNVKRDFNKHKKDWR